MKRSLHTLLALAALAVASMFSTVATAAPPACTSPQVIAYVVSPVVGTDAVATANAERFDAMRALQTDYDNALTDAKAKVATTTTVKRPAIRLVVLPVDSMPEAKAEAIRRSRPQVPLDFSTSARTRRIAT